MRTAQSVSDHFTTLRGKGLSFLIFASTAMKISQLASIYLKSTMASLWCTSKCTRNSITLPQLQFDDNFLNTVLALIIGYIFLLQEI